MAKSEYSKQLDRVQHLIKRYEAKGYETAYTRSTLKTLSLEELKEITPATVKEEARYINIETGEITEYDIHEQLLKEQRKQKRREKRMREKLLKDDEARMRFNEGNMVYNEFKTRLNQIAVNNPDTREYLNGILQQEIAVWGECEVIMRLANSGADLIEATEIALYYKQGYAGWMSAVNHIIQIITGSIPSAEESARLTEELETEDEYYED